MADKKSGDRGVVDSIARLRELRYMTRGPGAKPPRKATQPSIEDLRAKVAAVAKKPSKRRSKKKGTNRAKARS